VTTTKPSLWRPVEKNAHRPKAALWARFGSLRQAATFQASRTSPGMNHHDEQLLQLLRERLSSDQLPGVEAQNTMIPPMRGLYSTPSATARKASVLALLYPIDGQLQLLYIQRTSSPNDRHAGQISFPGGSAELTDKDAGATALRETEEEVGIPRSSITLLGALTPLYIPVSNFMVDPFVGFLPERPSFVLQETEVARVLELPFTEFLSQHARKVGPRKLASGMTLRDIPYWHVRGEEVWGATSMMTAELIALVKERRIE
jgi:8-oxo-dGTP pyrophosphatase MutT (NUDIX family)